MAQAPIVIKLGKVQKECYKESGIFSGVNLGYSATRLSTSMWKVNSGLKK